MKKTALILSILCIFSSGSAFAGCMQQPDMSNISRCDNQEVICYAMAIPNVGVGLSCFPKKR